MTQTDTPKKLTMSMFASKADYYKAMQTDTPTPRTAERRLGAEKLDATVLSASFWLESAEKQRTKNKTFFCAREAVNHWKNAAYHFSEETAKLERELNALREQLAAVSKDAERYQWIRHGDNDTEVLQFAGDSNCGTDSCWLLREESLDEAIDAAIAATKEPK